MGAAASPAATLFSLLRCEKRRNFALSVACWFFFTRACLRYRCSFVATFFFFRFFLVSEVEFPGGASIPFLPHFIIYPYPVTRRRKNMTSCLLFCFSPLLPWRSIDKKCKSNAISSSFSLFHRRRLSLATYFSPFPSSLSPFLPIAL